MKKSFINITKNLDPEEDNRNNTEDVLEVFNSH